MKTQFGKMVTCDFDEKTITIQSNDDVVAKAGIYAIVPIEIYNKMLKNKPQKKQNVGQNSIDFLINDDVDLFINSLIENDFFNYGEKYFTSDVLKKFNQIDDISARKFIDSISKFCVFHGLKFIKIKNPKRGFIIKKQKTIIEPLYFDLNAVETPAKR